MVGGSAVSGSSNTSPEELAHELQTFDMKVYRAQTQMVKEFTTKLKGFGVPFFGTKSELVKVYKKASDGESTDLPPRAKDDKNTIDELDLVKLQKKMITLLEDLCGD